MSDNSYEGEEHFDKYDHYNYDQEKVMMSGNSGEWRAGDWQGGKCLLWYVWSRETEVQEGGRDEHQQTQPRGAWEEDCHQADQHGEESEDE